MPRFDQSFNGLCEQNFQDTLQLKQRYLDAKNKQRVTGGPKAKHQDKQKQSQQLPNATIQQQQQQEVPSGPPQNLNTASSSIQSSVHVQQKFLKRPADELDPGGGPPGGPMGPDGSSYEPPVKLQCTTQAGGHQSAEGGLTKFSVEIVQQLEFTTSAANSQPQQISTNVTVKAHTNTSVKSDISSPKPSESSTPTGAAPGSTNPVGNNVNINTKSEVSGNLADCVKQEPDNDFADLDQCAAALEKDAVANGGTGFGGLSDLIGDDTNDEIITPDALKDLISDISNYPEFMKDFDFEDAKTDLGGPGGNLLSNLKVEDLHQGLSSQQLDNVANIKGSPIPQNVPVQGNNMTPNSNNPNANQNFGGGNVPANMFDKVGAPPTGGRVPAYHPGMEFGKTELSPAAQTLKQMAEQHQHKTQNSQMGTGARGSSPFAGARSGVLGNGGNNPRSPYHSDFHSPFQNSTGDYGSPGGPGFASPQIKNSPGFPSPHHQQQSNPSESYSIKQDQQLHINQQQGGIQVSAGQQLHLSGDLKGNVSIASQQGMHFNQQQGNNPNNPGPQQNQQGGPQTPGNHHPQSMGPQQNMGSQQNPSGVQQQQQSPMHGTSMNQQLHLSGELKGNVSIASQQGMHFNQNQQVNPSGNGPPQQQQGGPGTPGGHHPQQNVGGGMGPQQNPPGVQQQQPSPMHAQAMNQQGGLMGPSGGNMMGPGGTGVGMGLGSPATGSMSHHHHQGHGMGGMATPQHLQQQQQLSNNNQMMGGDGYSLTQSQTINFTQQTLRQRGGQNPNGLSQMMGGPVPNNMAMAGTPGPQAAGIQGLQGQIRHMNPHIQQQQQQQQQQQTLMEQKLIQHQQMLRVQQQQQSLMSGMGQPQQQMIRPPPPDYKTSAAGLMQQQGALQAQPRYAGASGLPPTMRRMPHQPMPPSGPMMRHSMYMMQQHQQQQTPQGMMVGGPLRQMYGNRQPNPMAGGNGQSMEQMSHTNSAEWRHLMMSQQQSNQFQQGGPGMRPGAQFQHTQTAQGFGVSTVMGGGNAGGPIQQQMTTIQQQQHLLRQQQTGGNTVMGNVMGGGGNQGMGGILGQQALMPGPQSMGGGPQGMGGPPNMSQVQSNNQMVQQQLLMQQQQTLLHQQQQQINSNNGSQIAINNIHMQQSQSISMTSAAASGPGGVTGMHSNNSSLANAPFNQSADDFNLDFLANIPGSDTGAFTEQELLNSFDSDSGFNLDIL